MRESPPARVGAGSDWTPRRPCFTLGRVHGRRRLARTALSLCVALVAVPAAPAPAAGLETLVQDDATLLHRPAPAVAASMARLHALGVDRVRLTADWSSLAREPDAATRPDFDAADPAAYEQARWRALDRAVVAARDAGLSVLVDVGFWAPRWATDSPPGPRARSNVDPADYAAFVQAVLLRYDGAFVPPPEADAAPEPAPRQAPAALDPAFGMPEPDAAPAPGAALPLPAVGQFALWNEPNHPSLLLPQWTGTSRDAQPASPGVYRRMLAAAIPAARAVRPDAELLVGNTSSTAGTPGSGAVPPLRFLRELACVDRALRPLSTPECRGFSPIEGDGWAHHPYTRNRRPDLRARPDRPDDVGVADLGKLEALLRALADRGRIAPGLTRIHVTEFGYETSPVAGRPTVSEGTQARWLTWAEHLAASTAGVVSFAQFLLRDQPPAAQRVSDSPARAFGQFATGLERADGTPKPAATSFVTGLFAREVATRHRPPPVALWVRLRLGRGGRSLAVQEEHAGAWSYVLTRPVTGGTAAPDFSLDGRSATSRILPRHRGTRLRIVVFNDDGSVVRGVPVPIVAPPPAAG